MPQAERPRFHDGVGRDRLFAMSKAQRLAAYERGELNLGDCLAWAGRFPDEPPTVPSGEFLFIAVLTPDWADASVRTSTAHSIGR